MLVAAELGGPHLWLDQIGASAIRCRRAAFEVAARSRDLQRRRWSATAERI